MVAGGESLALRADILRAFADTVRPPQEEIALHQCDECAALRAAFAPYMWDRVPPQVIEAHYSALPLFSPSAFAYFLPAYLLYALDHFTPDSGPSEFTIYSLVIEEPVNEHHAAWHRERLKPLTRSQVNTVERFLDLVEADEEFASYLQELAPGRARFREFWASRESA